MYRKRRMACAFLMTALMLSGRVSAQSVESKALSKIPTDVVVLDTKPLPRLKEQDDVCRLSPDALTDAFGLPIFVKVSNEEIQDDALAGGEIGRIVNKLNIQGILPGQEALIESFVVPMGGSFAVKVKDNEVVLLHIQEITDQSITFGWAKDDTTYQYRVPKKSGEDVYLDLETDQMAQKGGAAQ